MQAVRASVIKHYYSALKDGLVPGARGVFDALDPQMVDAVESASRLDWLPVEFNFAPTRLITERLGVGRGEEFFTRLYGDLFESKIFRPLIHGIRALGATNPGSYLKHAGRGYEMTFRRVGRIETGPREENSLRLLCREFPEPCFDKGLNWLRYSAAIYAIAFDLTECPGSYRVEDEAPMRGSATIIFEW